MLAFIINKCPELLVLQKESIQGMGGEEAPEVLCSPLFTFAGKVVSKGFREVTTQCRP